jgi:hypothetical protein
LPWSKKMREKNWQLTWMSYFFVILPPMCIKMCLIDIGTLPGGLMGSFMANLQLFISVFNANIRWLIRNKYPLSKISFMNTLRKNIMAFANYLLWLIESCFSVSNFMSTLIYNLHLHYIYNLINHPMTRKR